LTTQDKPRLLIVDFENVQQVDLSLIDDSYRIVIFVGQSQKSVPFSLVTAAQNLGNQVEWQKISGEGRNALDFFIAWYLGRVFEQPHRPECYVLSKDKGFDPLLRHLNAAGLKCKRVDNLSQLEHRPTVERRAQPEHRPAVERRPQPEHRPSAERRSGGERRGQPASRPDLNYKRVIEVLGKSEKRSRPRKRKTLAQCISAMFQKKLPQDEINALIDVLLVDQMITEDNNSFTYHF
jgi:hypothetical protein